MAQEEAGGSPYCLELLGSPPGATSGCSFLDYRAVLDSGAVAAVAVAVPSTASEV